MGWIYLLFGVLFEVAGTWSMKLSDGLTRPLPSDMFVGFFSIALILITLSMKTIDMSIAYAIWCGAGIVLISGIGHWYFNEMLTPTRLIFIGFILIGVVGLYLSEQ